MAPPRSHPGEVRVAFDAISIEGGLLGAEWLGKVARLQVTAQEPADYRVPKGLHIRDEIARSWRIAEACFQEMESGRASGGDARALAERFVEAFLRDAFCFASLAHTGPRTSGERVYPVRFFALGDRVPVVAAPMEARPGHPPARARRRPASTQRLRAPAGDPEHLRRGALGSRRGRALAAGRARQRESHAAGVDRSRPRPDLHGGAVPRLRGAVAPRPRVALRPRRRPARDMPAGSVAGGRPAGGNAGAGQAERSRSWGRGSFPTPRTRSSAPRCTQGTSRRSATSSNSCDLVYRLVFLLTVEERNLLHPKNASDSARRLYADGYALRRLRDRAVRGSAHDRQRDLWEGGHDRLPRPCRRRTASRAARPRRPVRAGGVPGPRRGEAGEPRPPRRTLSAGVASRALGARSRELARHGSG